MGNSASETKDEFVAQGIHYHKKRWKLYNKDIRAAMVKKENQLKTAAKNAEKGRTSGQLCAATTTANMNNSVNSNGLTYKSPPICDRSALNAQNGSHRDITKPVEVISNGKVPASRPTSLELAMRSMPDSTGINNALGENGVIQGIQNHQGDSWRGVQTPPGDTFKKPRPEDRELDPFWYRSADHIENVVMSGGGGKGYCFIGALKALDDCGVLSRLRRVAGSSVGGICAGLLAIGCNPQEIADIFSVDNRWLFQDQSCTAIYCVPNIMKKFGVHPADRFYRIYGGHIARKTGNPDITFKQLYEQTGRELCIVVTNLNKMCAEYCHPKTTPNMPVRLAVRMTMSFPVLYQPVQCEINGVTSWYTDGGILDQYPIHAFDGGMLDMNHNASTPTGDEEPFNNKTLGLYVVGETALDYQIWKSLFGYEIPFHPSYVPNTKLTRKKLKDELDTKDHTQKLSPLQKQAAMVASLESVFEWPGCTRQVNIEKFGDYVGATIEALLVQQRKLLVKPRDVYRTIPVNAGYIGTNDYVLETADREFMIRQGYECVRRFLIEYSEDAYFTNTKTANGHVTPNNGIPPGVVRHYKNQDCFHRGVSMETQV